MCSVREKRRRSYSRRGARYSRTGWRFRWMWSHSPSICFCRTSNSLWKCSSNVSPASRTIGNSHSDGGHLPHNFRVAPIVEASHVTRGQWMRDHQQLAFLQLAPGARIAVAQFDEINWAIILRTPSARLNLRYPLVHLYE